MKLSKTERWILSNQYKILGFLDPGNKQAHEMMQEILQKGYETEYDEITLDIYDGNDVMTAEKCQYVISVLAMYEALQLSYDNLDDKQGIDAKSILFPGFDGNNEPTYLNYALFLRSRREAFADIQVISKSLNSHSRTHDVYTRMLKEWKRLDEAVDLSREQIQSILNARIHPDNR